MAFQWWPAAALRWLETGISYLTPRMSSFSISGYLPESVFRWPASVLSFSIVDDVLWTVVTALESVALVSMLCFFFVFCGCNI